MLVNELLRRWFGLAYTKCDKCDVLAQQLAVANDEKRKLLNTIIELTNPKPVEQPAIDPESFKPLGPAVVPWSVTRSKLEEEDRKRAEVLKTEFQKNLDREREALIEKTVGKSTSEIEAELLGEQDADRESDQVPEAV